MFSAVPFSLNMGSWLSLLLDVAAKSLLVSAAALAALLCLRQAPASTRHLVLLAGLGVLLGLPALMPLLPRQELPRPVPAPRAAPAAAPAPALPALTVPLSPAPTVPPSPAQTAPPVGDAPAAPSEAAPTAALPPSPTLSLPPLPAPPAVRTPPPTPAPLVRPAWLVLGWLLGVLACAGRMLAAQTRVRRLTRRCPPLPPSLLPAADLQTGCFTALKTGPTGTPPMVWGWPRPTLLLPPEAAGWPTARLRAVVLHESAHVRRQDWLTQTLTQLTCALYWFNPLVWLLAARLGAEAERACDDAVLLAGVPPTEYAQDLLAVARHLGAGRAARQMSVGAVTMARRSPVRGRLEAILDIHRPRRRLTRRSAALALAAALAVAAPLAALRRADEAPAGQAAPAAGQAMPSADIPTEADLANTQQHLRGLERMRTSYLATHPNTLTSAQTALLHRLRQQVELKDDVERNVVREITGYTRAKAETKKPHSVQEQKKIQQTIYGYEHTTPNAAERQQTFERTFGPRFAELKRKVALLPAEQTARAARVYGLNKAIALDETRIDIMQMERSEGYPLHMDADDVALTARLGLDSQLAGSLSRSALVHLYLLDAKLGQGGHLDDTDIAPDITILRTRPERESAPHLAVLFFFGFLHNATPAQQQKIREAITPFLTSKNYNERYDAKRALRWFGGSAPTPPPAQKALAVPAVPHQTTLLKTAALTTLADNAPAGQAKPMAGVPTEADMAKVQQHLRGLEQARANYAAAHPNTLTAAQVADVDRLIGLMGLKRDREHIKSQEKEEYVRAKRESKKPHNKWERERIWRTIFGYEHVSPFAAKWQHDFDLGLAQLKRRVERLPAQQRVRETSLYAFDSQTALDKTRLQRMQLERAEGYPLRLNQENTAIEARYGLEAEKGGGMSRADCVYMELLKCKLEQERRLDDTDVDSLIALLHAPSGTPDMPSATVLGIFHQMHDPKAKLLPVPPSQQQKIREAMIPLLTRQSKQPALDKLDHKFALEVLELYGGSAPTGATPPKPPG